ncbi:Arc family DNA-binding protein [Serratia marcescens]|uniref:Arc family DNA-binding protein n=1 Tax=Serratia marcescens TaxID=615 RepID=UPI00069F25B8|nr:Arc family DNA-binding protein [Serratia marcescens]MDP8626887.1 Arc family DNA-binding protein [Serratia marcescens]MDP8676321.1 Arc family DNA-binding protein [Serratia marcescens]MDP8691324.1 Arc family DNA-binding protein [Serratia marcescens]MDP8700981.1 Arc family DNA-binding protein [Serratia marcescens]MDP8710747.1 Arc family DNA-binding protein [Serratia marcescens]
MAAPRNPQFNVRIPPELKKEVVALAEKNKRSVNAEIVAAIEAAIEEGKQGMSVKRPGIGLPPYEEIMKKLESIEKKIDKPA